MVYFMVMSCDLHNKSRSVSGWVFWGGFGVLKCYWLLWPGLLILTHLWAAVTSLPMLDFFSCLINQLFWKCLQKTGSSLFETSDCCSHNSLTRWFMTKMRNKTGRFSLHLLKLGVWQWFWSSYHDVINMKCWLHPLVFRWWWWCHMSVQISFDLFLSL